MLAAPPLSRETLSRARAWLGGSTVMGLLPAAVASVLLAALFVGPLLLVALAARQATPFFWFSLITDLVLLFAFALLTWRRPLLFVGLLTA